MRLRKRTSYESVPQQGGGQVRSGAGEIGRSVQHMGARFEQDGQDYMATASGMRRVENQYMSTASGGSSMRNTSVSQMPIEVDVDPLLKDIVFSEDLEQKKLVMRLYTDIYHNDSIAGSIVDIKSTLMFSEFTLGGILDRKVADDFQENIERLDLRTLMPDMQVDYDVKGAFVGSLLYNGTSQVFSRVMPHAYENVKVDQLPFHGTDPLITVAFPEHIRSTMASDSPRVKALREFLGADVMKQLSNEALELDPKSTVYVPRRGGSTSTAISYYRRVLPWYLMEKNLFRGTLVRSAMRQKGILHITLDGAGEWEPTVADMQMATDLFMNADADPIGAVVATRGGISTEEIRDPQGGWTVFDNKDSIDAIKMKALGIGEAFLSGDATYTNGDTSTSFFIDGVRMQRDYLTRKALYNKIFPMISALKGYTLNASGKLIKAGNSLEKLDPLGSFERLNDGTRLLIPTVHWEKTLKPEGDQQYLDMLQAMSDKGVPVPLRAMAAAGGVSLDRILADQAADLHIQEALYEYQKKVKDLKKKYGISDDAMGGGMGGDGGFASTAAAFERMPRHEQEYLLNATQQYYQALGATSSDVRARDGVGFRHWMNRDFGEYSEVGGMTHDGKPRYLHNQNLANERANRKIVKMIQEMKRKGTNHLVRTTSTPLHEGRVTPRQPY